MHSILETAKTQGYNSGKSHPLCFILLCHTSWFLHPWMHPPSLKSSGGISLDKWSKTTSTMPGAPVTSTVDNHHRIIPAFLLCYLWKKSRKSKQGWVNRCEIESLKTVSSVCFFQLFFWRHRFFFLLTVICTTFSPLPLCTLCGGRFEEFSDSKLWYTWERRAAGVVEQREKARQGLGFIKTQPPVTGTATQHVGEGCSTKYLS